MYSKKFFKIVVTYCTSAAQCMYIKAICIEQWRKDAASGTLLITVILYLDWIKNVL